MLFLYRPLLLYHAVLLVALALRKNPPFDLRPLRRGFSPGYVFIATVIFSLVTAYLFRALLALNPSGTYMAQCLAHVGLTTSTFIPFAVYLTAVNPILEEAYWRGNYASRQRTNYLNHLFYPLPPTHLFTLRQPHGDFRKHRRHHVLGAL